MMHPDYIDELIRREQQRDWQRRQAQDRLARVAQHGRAHHSNLGHVIVKWLRLKLNPTRRQAGPVDETQPRLVFKR